MIYQKNFNVLLLVMFQRSSNKHKKKIIGIMWHPEREKIFLLKILNYLKIFLMHDILFLSAGSGKRLNPYTINKPKCFVRYKKRSLIENQMLLLGTSIDS